MATLTIGDYRPDVSDLNQAYTKSVSNVLPQGDGYGPWKGLNVFTDALPAACRGVFFARNTDGSVSIFAGTEARLYLMDNTTLEWTDVSKSGTDYAALSTEDNWTFAQFNSVVIACQANEAPQAYTLGSSTEFANLGGSPPQAAYVSVVGRFVVLSGLLANPRRVQWSGLNAITTWTSGVTYSDFQDMPDGGNTKGVVGGQVGIIIQDSAIRRMTYSPGADIIFQIDRIAKDIGCNLPYAIVDADGLVMMPTTKGFQIITADGGVKPIGKERVDRTFFADVDQAAPQYCIGSTKPGSNIVIWAYKEQNYSGAGFNKALAYDVILDRWAPISLEGQYLASLAKPGMTLEGLGTIGSIAVTGAADNGSGLVRLTVGSTTGWTTGDIKDVVDVGGTTEANGTWTITVIDGTHIDLQASTYANAYTSGGYIAGALDDLDMSLDDFPAETLGQLAMVNTDGALGYFNGDNVEATLETAEQSAVSKRIFVRGYFPITDAATIYASVARRENLNDDPSYTTETLINAQGFCPQRASTRHARAKLRIPAATEWSFVTGVDPDFTYEGAR